MLVAVLAAFMVLAARPALAQDDDAAADTTAAVADEATGEAGDDAMDMADAYDPWAPGRQWMSVRAGYAKSTEDSAGHGMAGYGMSYRYMLPGYNIFGWTPLKKYSIGAAVQHDVLGRFGPAAEVEISATVDLVRHYAWGPYVHPHLGLGLGPHYRKTYRTGNDLRDVSLGWYITTGMHTPVSGRHLIGVDFRLSRVKGKNDPPNPVFGLGSIDEESSGTRTVFKERSATHWSIKADYVFTF